MNLLKFLIVLALFFIGVLLFYAFKYRNPYRFRMYIGKKGSGKTTMIVKLALKYQKKGMKVYSTVPVPGCYFIEPYRLGVDYIPPNSVILIDEVGMVWDNRNFKEFSKANRDYFKLQRHYKHIVYAFSQAFDIDIKLRNLTDELYIMRSFCNCMSLARKVLRRITILSASREGQATGESRIVDDLKYDSLLFFWCGAIQFTWLPKYAKYFDSYDVPELPVVEHQLYPGFKSVPFMERLRISFSGVGDRWCTYLGKLRRFDRVKE